MSEVEDLYVRIDILQKQKTELVREIMKLKNHICDLEISRKSEGKWMKI